MRGVTISNEQPQSTATDPEAGLRKALLFVIENSQCTCTPESDIRDCPNYSTGDEKGWDDDDG